jgi:hypothetical protein
MYMAPQTIRVEHGLPVHVSYKGEEYFAPDTYGSLTIDSLFAMVARFRESTYRWKVIHNRSWRLDITSLVYDQHYGIPLYLEAETVDTDGMPIFDSQSGFRVSRFTPLRCP